MTNLTLITSHRLFDKNGILETTRTKEGVSNVWIADDYISSDKQNSEIISIVQIHKNLDECLKILKEGKDD